MSGLFTLVTTLLLVAGGVFYREQKEAAGDVVDVPGIVFLFGLLVRMALTVVLLSLTAIMVSALFTTV